MGSGSKLGVVMPVYNEKESLKKVVLEWLPIIRKTLGKDSFIFYAINDGSTDNTLEILKELI